MITRILGRRSLAMIAVCGRVAVSSGALRPEMAILLVQSMIDQLRGTGSRIRLKIHITVRMLWGRSRAAATPSGAKIRMIMRLDGMIGVRPVKVNTTVGRLCRWEREPPRV